ncbi:hypothetical protein Pmar_PMAR002986 [Perkinsus marinus ATCC 50983]|uniref:Condensin complex subunit 1 C-terminal domain-containing protein n=1 Tax=Perkinsus marinus (strain ATCC 50983 / TXsc) TaxID=423536 RepID=C5LR29_PERM5|nr:hypothetical protein Pmar_PMAR002986 [Perkinsus marinus ATCC 50983]EER00914.1 hypothetical protein Pmar_PMAR002986 [Perkinsus marinus ATCC 50983]|eukprot:XP_002768196.1 hypothetical protein Pmar_PMAR002986 [Perkinsus marinus ATCC 50983]
MDDSDSDCDMVSAVSEMSMDSEQDDGALAKVTQMLEKYNFKDNPEAVGVITETIVGVIRDHESDAELILKCTEILSDMASPEHGPPHWRCALVFRALLPVILMDNYPKEKTLAAPTASMRSAKDMILQWIIGFVREHPLLLCRRLVEKDVDDLGGEDDEDDEGEDTPSGSEEGEEGDEGIDDRQQRKRRRGRAEGPRGDKRRRGHHSDDESNDSDDNGERSEQARRGRGRPEGAAAQDDDSEDEGNQRGGKKEVMMDPVMGLIQRICTLCPEKKDWREAAATIVTLLESFAEQVVELELDEGTLTSRFASFVELLLTTNRAGFRAFAIDVVGVLVMRAEKAHLEKDTAKLLLQGVLGCVLDPVSTVRAKAILGVGSLLKALVLGGGSDMAEEDRDWLRGVARKIPEIIVRAASDEKTGVRTVCTKVIDMLIDVLEQLNQLAGDETLFVLPLDETLPTLGLDSAVSVRKAAIATTDRILQMLSGRHREVLERLYPAIENGRNSDPHSKSSSACKPYVSALEKVIEETSNDEDPQLVQALWMGDVVDPSLVAGAIRVYFSQDRCSGSLCPTRFSLADFDPLSTPPEWSVYDQCVASEGAGGGIGLEGDPQASFGHLCLLKAVLFVMKQVAARVDGESSTAIARLLLEAIKEFKVPLTVALPVIELVKCFCDTHRATKQALQGWQKDLVYQMETCVYQGAVYRPERPSTMLEKEAKRLAAALGYLGDLVLACEESGKKNVSCFSKPESTYTNIHVLATDSVFSDIMSGNPKQHFRIPVPVRAQAIICLGKVCLKNEKQAKNLADVFALLLRHFEPVVVRNNAFVVLYDLCVQYTGLVDPRLPMMTRALNDEIRFYRHQAMMVISSLMAEDYVKFRGQTVYRYLTVLADENEEIRSFVESFFTRILIPRQHGLFADVFVKSICALNCWKGHPLYASAAQNNREFSLQEHTVKRERIYRFMMEYFDEAAKFKVVNEIMTRLLTRFLDDDGTARPLPLPQTEEESGATVYNVFCLLCCRELRLHMKSGGGRDLTEQQRAMGNEENEDPNVQGERRDAAERSKKYMQETMIPTLLQLRNLMQSETSPFVYHINNCLRELLREFKDEIATFCNGDDQLAVELIYDLNMEGRGALLLGRNDQGNNGETANQRSRGPASLRLFDIADGHGDQMGINVGLDVTDGVAPAGLTDFQRRMMSRARKKAKAALPRIIAEMRGIFDNALAQHGEIIQDMTRKNLQVIESQGRAMQQTMSTMNRLVACGALTMGTLESEERRTKVIRRFVVFGIFGMLFTIAVTKL